MRSGFLVLCTVLLLIIFVNANDMDMTSNDFTYTQFVCNGSDDCSGHGVCNNNNTACNCYDGYVTYDTNGKQCNYVQKKGLTALLLAIFLPGTGAMNFYIGNNTYALIQLFLCGFGGIIGLAIIACILGCACCCCGGNRDGKLSDTILGIIIIVLMFLMSFAIFGWWIADIVLSAKGELVDGNGIALAGI